MNSTYGENLTLTVFGSSHAPQIGMKLEGIPAGLSVDLNRLQAFLDRRAPGRKAWSTARKEADIPSLDDGILNGFTTGAPITATIPNQNIRKADYETLKSIPRPGHADYTAWIKYGTDFDMSGGGPFSGRMTAPVCIAGGLCKQWLETMGIRIGAHIASIADIDDNRFDPISPDLDGIDQEFPVINPLSAEQMQKRIAEAQKNSDSVGGIIECAVTGLPTGIGGHLFDGLEGKLAHILYSIPAVKGVEFGLGFDNARHPGSYTNDPFILHNGRVCTQTNHCGGILGGITTGMPVLFRVAMKPTPSIARQQQSVNLQIMEETAIEIQGRHDPCIVPRAVPVVEAVAAIAIYDLILGGN